MTLQHLESPLYSMPHFPPHPSVPFSLTLPLTRPPLCAANDFRSPSVRVPLVQSREVDENDDGLTDRLELNLQTPLKTGETIYAASAFVFLEYRVRALLDEEVWRRRRQGRAGQVEGAPARGNRPRSSTVWGVLKGLSDHATSLLLCVCVCVCSCVSVRVC